MNSFGIKALAVIVGGGVILGGGIYFTRHSSGSGFLAAVSKTAENIFGEGSFSSSKPAFEVSLTRDAQETVATSGSNNSSGAPESTQPLSPSTGDMQFFVPVPESTPSADQRRPGTQTNTDNANQKESSQRQSAYSPRLSASVPVGTEEDIHCNFSNTIRASDALRINELAWMGSTNSANDEWIELKNNSANVVALAGWQIISSDEKFHITFTAGEKISANGFYLLERTDDNSVPGVTANKIYAGALANGGAWLKLFNTKCEMADEVNGQSGFVTLGGDASARKTLERNADGAGWHTSAQANGTPMWENSLQPQTNANSASGLTQTNAENNTTIPDTTTVIAPTPTPEPLPQPTSTPPAEPAPTPPAESPSTVSGILITEVMAGTDGKADNEFIELYNPSDDSVPITGWSIKKKSSTGNESSLVVASRLEGIFISAHGYLLFGNDGGYIGTPPADVVWAHSYTLAYTNNAVTLYNASGTKVSDLNWTEIPVGKSFGRKNDGTFAVLSSPSPKAGNIE